MISMSQNSPETSHRKVTKAQNTENYIKMYRRTKPLWPAYLWLGQGMCCGQKRTACVWGTNNACVNLKPNLIQRFIILVCFKVPHFWIRWPTDSRSSLFFHIFRAYIWRLRFKNYFKGLCKQQRNLYIALWIV